MPYFKKGLVCGICSKPLNESDPTAHYPSFIKDPTDPIAVFNGMIMHASCYSQHPLWAVAEAWISRARERGSYRNRICVACGVLIERPDDYFGTGPLARNERHPLWPYNFVHLHKHHAVEWPQLHEFVAAVDSAVKAGLWTGPTVEFDASNPSSLDWASLQPRDH